MMQDLKTHVAVFKKPLMWLLHMILLLPPLRGKLQTDLEINDLELTVNETSGERSNTSFFCVFW